MDQIEILRGPNIKEFPTTDPLPETIAAKALLKVGDNITTDHIMPAGAKILPYRSNIPYLSNFCFAVCDKEFPERCKKNMARGIVIGGANYGQGSSVNMRRLCRCIWGKGSPGQKFRAYPLRKPGKCWNTPIGL